jgi:poly-gamma-glutamate synthesis protein (capsule biosynthesis protein)
MAVKSLSMLAVGDLVLEDEGGERFLALAAPSLRKGNVVVGQGEIVFTDRGIQTYVEMGGPSPGCPPNNMNALAAAGFNVITLAGNHIWDMGAPGIEDTVKGLNKLGIAVTGGGMNIDEARKPAVIERDGTRFGFLSYNCVGGVGQWATKLKPGCAYVRIISHYEMNGANPGGPPDVFTWAEPGSLKLMTEDIRKLRPLCDVLVVALHKGVLGFPDKLAAYDQQVSYAAIDAGADLILGHHAHILKGIEEYKGKVIFHGLGHFIFDVAKLPQEFRNPLGVSPGAPLYGPSFNPGIDPLSRWTIIAKCTVDNGKISQVGYLPCLINEEKQTEVLKHDARGQQMFDFMDRITKGAGLNVGFEWKGDEVVVKTV